MQLHEKIKEEVKDALKAKDADHLRAARNLLAAFTNDLVARRKKPSGTVSDEEALSVVARLAKQRKDSIAQFKEGGRDDLVQSEEKELTYLEQFLPKMMSKEEILQIVEAKKKKLGIEDKSKIGVLVGAVMFELKNKADGKTVREIVE